jgi:hypothetical protein
MFYYNYFIQRLNEGLITTFPISLFEQSLKNSINQITNSYKININYNKETFSIELSKISQDNIDKVDAFCNNFGYFLAQYKIDIGNSSNVFKYGDKEEDKELFIQRTKNYTLLILFYDSKFDEEILINDKIYHITNIKNLSKIDKVGLYPRSGSKIKYHPDRIYFSDSIYGCISLIPKLKVYEESVIKDYIILEIDAANLYHNNYDGSLSKTKFMLDPDSSGFYTYYNIPKNNIKILNKIYTIQGIIDFDNIIINNKKIVCLNNNQIVYDQVVNLNK